MALPTPPAPSTSAGLAAEPDGRVFAGGGDRLLEAVHGGAVIGVVAGALVLVEDDGVGGADAAHGVVGLVELGKHGFLVRNGDAQAADADGGRVVDEGGEVFARDADGHVDLVQLEVLEGGVVDERAQAVADRIGDDAVDLGGGVDLVVAVGVASSARS